MRKLLSSFIAVGFVLSASASPQEKVVPQTREEIHYSYAPLVKKVAPAVVSIYTSHVVKVNNPLSNDPLLNQLLGGNFLPDQSSTRIERSLGSGVIVRENGIIVTNYHVVKDAQNIKVILADGREYQAEVVSKEKRTDLASIKIKDPPENLPFLELVDMDELEVGDLVLAIGSPFGLEQTVTNGIISALARTQLGVSDSRSFIQTDAAINPGNSGGALVNMDGRLAGINSGILSESGGFIGIGFAIPSNLIVPVIESYKYGGEIIRPWIGADVKNVTWKEAKSYGVSRPLGVIITGVYPNSPAAKAGLMEGDLIDSFDGKEVKNTATYKFRIASRTLHHIAILKVLNKEGEEREIQVHMQEPPKAEDDRHILIHGRNPLEGARVASLSPVLAIQWGVDFMEKGIIVLSVESNSFAQRLGLSPGDIITKINDKQIDSLKEMQQSLTRTRSVRQYRNEPAWTISVKRGNRTYTVIL